MNGVLKARKHEKIDTLTSATGFTAANYEVTGSFTGSDTNFKTLYCEEVIVSVETADIRWCCDGTDPVATATSNGTGHLAAVGDAITITGYENIKKFRAINAVNASGSKVRVTFFFRQ